MHPCITINTHGKILVITLFVLFDQLTLRLDLETADEKFSITLCTI